MNPSDMISQTIVKMFERERFYAEIILQMDRFVTTSIPTAGVNIKDQVCLYVNPDFFGKLTPDERVAVLRHECEHILRNHIPRCKELAPEVYGKPKDEVDGLINGMKHQGLNIAADCSINGGIENLPGKHIHPKQFDLPIGETLEWYLLNLKDNEKAKQAMEYDDHSLWGESEGDKETIAEKIRQRINKAAERTRSAGLMTASDELLVSRLNKNLVDWKQQLKRFVARSNQVFLESSRKKRNRRYGISIPGDVKIERLHIGVAIDTSGSVSDAALTQFMAEISNISRYADVTVVEADTEIKNVYVFDPKKTYTVKGRGGTAYKPAFDFFNKYRETDAMIYFGDMDNYDVEVIKKPRYPVLWAIVGNSPPPADFGSQIRIPIK